jgi:hypothetical protein
MKAHAKFICTWSVYQHIHKTSSIKEIWRYMESLNFFFFGCVHRERFAVLLFLTCSPNANGIKISLSGKKNEPQLADELLLKCEKRLVDKNLVQIFNLG